MKHAAAVTKNTADARRTIGRNRKLTCRPWRRHLASNSPLPRQRKWPRNMGMPVALVEGKAWDKSKKFLREVPGPRGSQGPSPSLSALCLLKGSRVSFSALCPFGAPSPPLGLGPPPSAFCSNPPPSAFAPSEPTPQHSAFCPALSPQSSALCPQPSILCPRLSACNLPPSASAPAGPSPQSQPSALPLALSPLPLGLRFLPSAFCPQPSALCPLRALSHPSSGLSLLPSAFCPRPSAFCPLLPQNPVLSPQP